jgi:hypothetical protein
MTAGTECAWSNASSCGTYTTASSSARNPSTTAVRYE